MNAQNQVISIANLLSKKAAEAGKKLPAKDVPAWAIVRVLNKLGALDK